MISHDGPIDNRLFVLILQHPQEKKEAFGTAAATVAALRRAALVVGLSWPNLSIALGWRAEPKRWGVAYLGSMRSVRSSGRGEIVAVDRRGVPLTNQKALPRDLEGVILLDGSWSEAKTLWWRNPWLLKLHRLVLDPQQPSRYGRVRRAARHEALATIECAALLLRHFDGGPAMEAELRSVLDRIIADGKPRRGGTTRATAARPGRRVHGFSVT
jgi:DTW domain-containing protein